MNKYKKPLSMKTEIARTSSRHLHDGVYTLYYKNPFGTDCSNPRKQPIGIGNNLKFYQFLPLYLLIGVTVNACGRLSTGKCGVSCVCVYGIVLYDNNVLQGDGDKVSGHLGPL